MTSLQKTKKEKILKEFDEKFGSCHDDRPMPSGLLTQGEIKSFLRTNLLTSYEEGYAAGRASMKKDIEAVMPKMRSVGGDTMDNDECERRWGHNDCRSQLLDNMKGIV